MKVHPILFLAAVVLSSCSIDNDWDILGLGYGKSSWQEELASIVDMNSVVLESSGVSLLDIVQLDDCYDISDDLICTDSTLMPVYLSNLSRFELIPYNAFKRDTSLIHYRAEYLETYIDSLLKSGSHTKVRLTWENNGKIFSSIALFDKQTGELEYDNLLFNVFSISSVTNNGQTKLLTRSEVASGGSNQHNASSIMFETNDCESIEFLNASLQTIAFASVSWSVYGQWVMREVYDSNDNLIGHERIYQHDCIERELSKWTDSNITGLTAEAKFEDRSTQDSVSMKYMLWAGLTSSSPAFNLDYYSIGPNATLVLDSPSWQYGVNVTNRGFVKTRSFKPYTFIPLQ